jgi:hypothetical protein
LPSWELPRAWGCTYSSVAFVWVKMAKRLGNQLPLFLIDDNKEHPKGQGHTTRKNCEYCLWFCYGRQINRQNKGVPQAIFAPRRAKSARPDEQYPRIMRLLKGPYVEFFARRRWPGWEQVWSREADSGPGKRRWRANAAGVLVPGSDWLNRTPSEAPNTFSEKRSEKRDRDPRLVAGVLLELLDLQQPTFSRKEKHGGSRDEPSA